MPDPQKQSSKQCDFHGANSVVVSEEDLRKAIADAFVAERKLWEAKGVLQKEDNDARFPDLVWYWLAGLDSSIRPDWLQALKAATVKTTYGNLTNTQLKGDIVIFNAADASFEGAIDTRYDKSGEVDEARAALASLEGPAAKAITTARNAKRALEKADKAKPRKQTAVDAAQAALTAAELDRNKRLGARDAASSFLKTKSSELKQAKADVEIKRKTRKDLIAAAENWTATDRETTRKDLFKQSSILLPKEIGVPVDAALVAAHNSRADTEPWSSAFVGASIRSAAINLGIETVSGKTHHGKDGLLKISRNHAGYIINARDNARPGRYQAFEPSKRAVQVGDIICTDRADFIEKKDRQTLKGLKTGTVLHGDVVVSVVSGAHGFAQTIGGNVGHTVRQRRYPIDSDDKLIVREEVLIDREDYSGNFTKGGPLGSFEELSSKPSMVDRGSSFRVFALLSPVGKCKTTPKTSREMFDLESPFLAELVLASESADELASSATGATLLESPFLTGILQPSTGDDD